MDPIALFFDGSLFHGCKLSIRLLERDTFSGKLKRTHTRACVDLASVEQRVTSSRKAASGSK
jgi:hypothetical protein